jgi:hypothetical protein
MHETELDRPEILPQQLAALSRWDNGGGAGPDGPQAGSCPGGGFDVPVLTNDELVQLRISRDRAGERNDWVAGQFVPPTARRCSRHG